MRIRIRPTEVRDISELYRVRASTRQNAISKQTLIEWGITPESTSEGLGSGRLAGRVCEQQGCIVGFCTGDTRSGEVLVLAVLPEHEGKGVGLALLTNVVEELDRQGCPRIWLACSADPASRSHGFYRRNGWSETGEKLDNGDEVLVLDRGTRRSTSLEAP